MTKFRNLTEKIIAEDSKYINTSNAFDDKINSWYNAKINPNLVLNYNAIWYGMPRFDSETNKATVDMDGRFIIKKVEKNQKNPNVIIQEVEKQLITDENGIKRWKNIPVGNKIAISSNALNTILKLEKNKPIFDNIMRLDTTKPRDVDADVWYDKFKAGLDDEKAELKAFRDENKQYFNIDSDEKAALIKYYVDRGYPKTFISKLLDRYIDSPSEYNKDNIHYMNRSIYELESDIKDIDNKYNENNAYINTLTKDMEKLRTAKDYDIEKDIKKDKNRIYVLERMYNTIRSADQQLSFEDVYNLEVSKVKVENEKLLKDRAELEKVLKAKNTPEAMKADREDSENLKMWNYDDYSDDFEKYGIK